MEGRLQNYFPAASRRLLNRQTHFQRPARELAVMGRRDLSNDGLVQFIEHVRPPWTSLARRNRMLADSAFGIDQEPIRGLTKVRLLATHHERAEMRLMPALALFGLPAPAAPVTKLL